MTRSLNEIDAISKKATRGCGMDWGIAEEAGKSVRWLQALGLDGAEHLADLFDQIEHDASNFQPPADLAEIWAAPGARLNPIVTGPTLCDCAQMLADGGKIELANVAHPLLIVPYAAFAGHISGQTLIVQWGDISFCVKGYDLAISGNRDHLNAAHADRLNCAPGAMNGDRAVAQYRAHISAATLARLMAFGHRTYAPATAASRALGAGSGSGDND